MTFLTSSLPAFANASGWGSRGDAWPGLFIPLLWVALIALVVWAVLRRRPAAPSEISRARTLLAERYARGEISTDEYRERLENLR